MLTLAAPGSQNKKRKHAWIIWYPIKQYYSCIMPSVISISNNVQLILLAIMWKQIVETEKHLANLAAPSMTIKESHKNFLEENGIPINKVHPEMMFNSLRTAVTAYVTEITPPYGRMSQTL